MYIEGRKNKPYSESLFNQLRLLAMLIQTESRLPDYIIDSRLHKSERTYRRYFHDLHACGLIPKVKRSKSKIAEDDPEETDSENRFFVYGIPYEVLDWNRYYLDWAKEYYVEVKDAILVYLEAYSRKHFNPQNRLYRCGRILICSYQDCWLYSDEYDEDELDFDTQDMSTLHLYKGHYYKIVFSGYDDLYEGMSLRSKQRDLKLLRDVIAAVLSDQESLG